MSLTFISLFFATSFSRAGEVSLKKAEGENRVIQGATFWYKFYYSASSSPLSFAIRPLGGSGGDHWLGMSVSTLAQFRITAFALYSKRGGSVKSGGGFEVGRAFEYKGFKLIPAFGILGEEGSGSGIYASGSALWMHGPFQLGGKVHLEKVFAQGRDPVDLIISMSGGVILKPHLSVEGEYILQDAEDLWEKEEREGGLRQAVFTALAFNLAPLKLKLKPGYILNRGRGLAIQTEVYLSF